VLRSCSRLVLLTHPTTQKTYTYQLTFSNISRPHDQGLEALLFALEKSIRWNFHPVIATDDAALLKTLHKAKSDPMGRILLCTEKASIIVRKWGAKNIKVIKCPSLTEKRMSSFKQAHANSLNLPIKLEIKCRDHLNSMEEFKRRTKEALRMKVTNYWPLTLAEEEFTTMKFSREILGPFNSSDSKELLKMERKDLRLFVCMMSGRALDGRTISNFEGKDCTCKFCGETEKANMRHWILECTHPDFIYHRSVLLKSGYKNPWDVEPEAWIGFAKKCKFDEFVFHPT
jgi:hypothetical protein